MNAPVLVALDGESDPLEIAIKELAMRKIPLIVRCVCSASPPADCTVAGFQMAPTKTGRVSTTVTFALTDRRVSELITD